MNIFFFVCLYKWNLWMFCSRLFISMESVNVFFIVCLYKWNLWMFSLLFNYINWISESGFNCKFIWIEHMCIFFIPCLNGSNMWMFPLMFANMCLYSDDLDSLQVAFIKIAQGFVALFKYRTYISTCFCYYHFFSIHFFSFCLYCLYINLLVCQSNGKCWCDWFYYHPS